VTKEPFSNIFKNRFGNSFFQIAISISYSKENDTSRREALHALEVTTVGKRKANKLSESNQLLPFTPKTSQQLGQVRKAWPGSALVPSQIKWEMSHGVVEYCITLSKREQRWNVRPYVSNTWSK